MTATTPVHWSVFNVPPNPANWLPTASGKTLHATYTLAPAGDALEGSIAIPAGSTLRSATNGNPIATGLATDEVPVKAGSPVVLRVTATLNVTGPADAKPLSAVVGIAVPNIVGSITVPVLPAGATATAPNLVGAVTISGIPVALGANTFTFEMHGTLLAGKAVVAATLSMTAVYTTATAGGAPTTADATIAASLRGEFVAEPPPAGGGAAGLNVLHFRDPADGKFKPLTEVRVRGVVDAAPDLGRLEIQWGTENVLTMDLAAATAHLGIIPGTPNYGMGASPVAAPASVNLRTSVTADKKLRIQADAIDYDAVVTSGFMGNTINPAYVAHVLIPVTGIAHLGDERKFSGDSTWSGSGWFAHSMAGSEVNPVLVAGSRTRTPWGITPLIAPGGNYTGAQNLLAPTPPITGGAAPARVGIAGSDVAKLTPPTVAIQLTISGGDPATPVGTYPAGCMALDVVIDPRLICLMPVVVP